MLRRLCFYRRLSVHRGGGGVCLSACWDTLPPGADIPPQSRHPREQTHTPPPLEQTPPPGADTPPGAETHPPEQTLPWRRHPPPQDTATDADGTHPTGMHSFN